VSAFGDLDRAALAEALDERGHAVVRAAVEPALAAELAGRFDEPRWFRTTIDMERHGYGRGTYRYFADPVPSDVAAMRADLYAATRPVADRWQQWLGLPAEFPPTHAGLLQHCAAAGQHRPTPLILHYEAGGYNRLHQDRYGAVAFPLQATVMLSPSVDYEGGQFVLVEQAPRRQSRADVVELVHGDMVVFPNAHRPVSGRRGHHRVNVRHGVAEIRAGQRRTLGLILHDAE
jgi:hypothetical protein